MNNRDRTKMIRRIAENLFYNAMGKLYSSNGPYMDDVEKTHAVNAIEDAHVFVTELERREPEWTKEGDAKKEAWKETEASYREVATDLRRRLHDAMKEIRRLQDNPSTVTYEGRWNLYKHLPDEPICGDCRSGAVHLTRGDKSKIACASGCTETLAYDFATDALKEWRRINDQK